MMSSRLRAVTLAVVLLAAACGEAPTTAVDSAASNLAVAEVASVAPESSTLAPVPTTTMMTTTTNEPEDTVQAASTSPSELAFAPDSDEDPLCDDIDDFLDVALAGQDPDEAGAERALRELPSELTESLTSPAAVQATFEEALTSMSAIDDETTRRCGVAFFNMSIHVSLACLPSIDPASFAELSPLGSPEGDTSPCEDPRETKLDVLPLEEQLRFLLDLADRVRMEFERIDADLRGNGFAD